MLILILEPIVSFFFALLEVQNKKSSRTVKVFVCIAEKVHSERAGSR